MGGSVEEVAPLGLEVGLEAVSALGGAGGGLEDGFLVEARGPVGGARSVTGFEGGLRDRGRLVDRGGVRVRVRVEVWSLRGERERERERRDGGSSVALVSLPRAGCSLIPCTNLVAIYVSLDSYSVPYPFCLSPHLGLHLYICALLFLLSSSVPYAAYLAGLWIDFYPAASLWTWICVFDRRVRDVGLYHLAFLGHRWCPL